MRKLRSAVPGWPGWTSANLMNADQTPDSYVGRNGFSWLHRRSRHKGLPNKGEPDPPEWVMAAF